MRVDNKLTRVVLSFFILIAGITSTNATPEVKEVYIVKFVDNVNFENEIANLKSNGVEVEREYKNIFKGAAIRMNSARAEALSRNPRIELLERDGVVNIQASQTSAAWGIDRIDQANLPLSTTYDYNTTGSGVTAYVIDTGIAPHDEFESRLATVGFSAFGDNNTIDCNGHGTHVAGTIGGKKYGIAKAVRLVPVRVLDCSGSGSWSGVIAGLDWIYSDRDGNERTPAVANMSLGGSLSSSINTAVQRLSSRGVTVVVAAGNSNRDACRFSPASEPTAITVGATTSTDARASYSNFGACLDVFAPGTGITSAWYLNSTSTRTISGTSMASPHVAGVVARILQLGNKSPSEISAILGDSATRNKVISAGKGSANRLLFIAPTN